MPVLSRAPGCQESRASRIGWLSVALRASPFYDPARGHPRVSILPQYRVGSSHAYRSATIGTPATLRTVASAQAAFRSPHRLTSANFSRDFRSSYILTKALINWLVLVPTGATINDRHQSLVFATCRGATAYRGSDITAAYRRQWRYYPFYRSAIVPQQSS